MSQRRTIIRTISIPLYLGVLLLGFSTTAAQTNASDSDPYGAWMAKPQSEWPQITMINQITYTDKHHPVAGCSFLLDTGTDTLAVTAKHILIFFKSERMKSVSFDNTLKLWQMFPKDNPADVVVVDTLINENGEEPLADIPSARDWLLFTIRSKSPNIQPLRFRTTPLEEGEPAYIIGWRYSDKHCPQVVYEGNFVRSEEGSLLITTKELADNTMPGLSGAPVIDAHGYLLGLMSSKAGKMERPSSTDYPKLLISERTGAPR